MESPDLTFSTTHELISELMRRETFFGCIVQSAEEHKNTSWTERTFRVHYNHHLDQSGAGRLLGTVADYLELA